MSDLVDILRTVKPGPTFKPIGPRAFSPKEVLYYPPLLPTLMVLQPKGGPYRIAPSIPWVSDGCSIIGRWSKKRSRSQHVLYSSKSAATSVSSFANLPELSSSQRLFSTPEPPFQIPDTTIISAYDNNDRVRIDCASHANSCAKSTSLATPASTPRGRAMSRRSKPLPPTPEASPLQLLPPTHPIAGPYHVSSHLPTAPFDPTRYRRYPEADANLNHVPSHQYVTIFSSDPPSSPSDGAWDPSCSFRQQSRVGYASPPVQHTGQLHTQKKQINCDTPPPAYQPPDTHDNGGVIFPSSPKDTTSFPSRRDITGYWSVHSIELRIFSHGAFLVISLRTEPPV